MGVFTLHSPRHQPIQIHNTVTHEGLKEAFRIFLTNDSALGDLYIGLIADPALLTPLDSFSNKVWTEFTNYTEKERQIWNRDSVSGATVPNLDCTPAAFTILGDMSLAGIFISDDDTKGGLVGNLLAVSDIIGVQYYEGDTLFIEYEWEW